MIQNVSRRELVLVLMVSLTVALVSARPYARSWNDGSRLALVESLVDFRTLSIDRSIFVDPSRAKGTEATPYDPQLRHLMERGTLDKVLIKGRFYSDKPMVPAFLMAACYQVLEWITGLRARSRPDLFVYAMTLISSGLAYVAAVLCIHLLGRRLLSGNSMALAVTISFALGSSALAYARQVNSHEGFLAVAAALLVCLHYLPQRLLQTPSPRGFLAGMGLLTGLGYSMDFAAGPLLLIAIVPLIIYRCRVNGRNGLGMVAVFFLSALPLIVLHHALNYHVGGTLRPLNTVAEYLFWPGSPFDSSNATGPWLHRSIWRSLAYALELLFGEKGFLLHQPVLILAFLGGIAVMIGKRALLPELPEMLFSFAWSGAVWLVYAWGSNNLAGSCATIRWFVPLLAPGYYVLLMVLRYRPDRYPEFLALAAGGMLLSALMWHYGPWMWSVPGYWFIVGVTLLGWSMAVLLRLELSIVFLLLCLAIGSISPKLLDKYRLSSNFGIPSSSQIDFSADAYSNRADAYSKAGDYRQAVLDYNRAIEINPNYAEAYYNRGALLGIFGYNRQAIEDYDRAIEINPKYAEAYYSRGAVYGMLGNNRQAIEDYDRAIEINPEYAKAYYDRGVVYGMLGNNRQAISDFDRAIRINPEYAEAYNNRGIAYGKVGDQRQAISDFDRAIEINPDYAKAYYNRGAVYGILRNNKQAISDFDKAIEINPDDAKAYYNRGIVYGILSNQRQEIEDLQKAARLGSEDAKNSLRSRGVSW
jgi:tetratricopeptide (TPR) repeat protein